MTTEYFITSNSFAAPFFSDSETQFVSADNPKDALKKYVEGYRHPAGLYSANCYGSSDDYHKGRLFLSQWLCNHEIEKQKLTEKMGSYSYSGEGPGVFKINDTLCTVSDPKKGKVI